MTNTSRRTKLMPQAKREELLKRGDKEAVARTQPSKLSDLEKFECVSRFQDKNFGKGLVQDAYVDSFYQIYNNKALFEACRSEGYRSWWSACSGIARERLESVQRNSKETGTPFKPSANPLAKLIEAEERIMS